jgi:hypothetical protein
MTNARDARTRTASSKQTEKLERPPGGRTERAHPTPHSAQRISGGAQRRPLHPQGELTAATGLSPRRSLDACGATAR